MSSSFILSFILSLFCVVLSQTPEYDGTSTVILQPQTSWSLKYNLGMICEDQNWGKTLYIDIHATTTEADLIFAFGTQTHYVGFGMAYDGILWVPLNNGETKRGGSLFVTPADGQPLQAALTTLEEQYNRTEDFRDSLITGTVQTDEWTVLSPCFCNNCNSFDECTAVKGSNVDTNAVPPQCATSEVKTNCENTPMATNASQIILEVRGNRGGAGSTQIFVTKNNVTVGLVSSSTWGLGQDVWLYFGIDAINPELFQLSKITSDDECSWTQKPTTYAPTQPTTNPSKFPTVYPTKNPTHIPTESPSYPTTYPTITPTYTTNIPTIYPTTYPTINPTTIPTSFTSGPSVLPTELPTIIPTNNPTILPSILPSIPPTIKTTTVTDIKQTILQTTEDVGNGNGNGNGNGQGKSSSVMEGDNAVFIWIGIAIGGVLLLGLLSVIGYRLYKKRKMGQQVGNVAYQSNWDSHY